MQRTSTVGLMRSVGPDGLATTTTALRKMKHLLQEEEEKAGPEASADLKHGLPDDKPAEISKLHAEERTEKRRCVYEEKDPAYDAFFLKNDDNDVVVPKNRCGLMNLSTVDSTYHALSGSECCQKLKEMLSAGEAITEGTAVVIGCIMEWINKSNSGEELELVKIPVSTSSSDITTAILKGFYKMPQFQAPLLVFLLQKLVTMATSSDMGQTNRETTQTILSHIKCCFLDNIKIYNPLDLVTTTLECITLLLKESDTIPSDHTINHSGSLVGSVLCDLIAILPSIVAADTQQDNDRIQNILVEHLREMYRTTHPDLLVACLDALSGIALSNTLLHLVVDDVIVAMQSCQKADLPAIAQFLFLSTANNSSSSSSSEQTQLLSEKVVSSFRKMQLFDTNREKHDGQHSNAVHVTLETLARGFQHQSHLVNTLHLLICAKGSTITPMDIWLLFCAAVAPHNRLLVLKIFKTTSSSQDQNVIQILQDAVVGNGVALDSVMGISDCGRIIAGPLLKATERFARQVGIHMYQLLFQEAKFAPFQRPDLVIALVSHTTSNESFESDAALAVLYHLVVTKSVNMKPYAAFIVTLLDSVVHMTNDQCRLLFLIVFGLLSADDFTTVGTSNDINVVLNKFLSHHSASMKRIGTIGAVAYAVTISAKYDRTSHYKTKGDAPLDEDVDLLEKPLKTITNILEIAYESCCPHAARSGSDTSWDVSSLVFYYEELNLALLGGQLAPPVKSWILNKVSYLLEEEYMRDFGDEQTGQAPSTMHSNPQSLLCTSSEDTLRYLDNVQDALDRLLMQGTGSTIKLDDTNRAAFNLHQGCIPRGEMRFDADGNDALIYLPILSILVSSDEKERECKLELLCPLLRLLASCHDEQLGGMGIGEIDAILGCPIFLPCKASMNENEFPLFPENIKILVAKCLFYATCWCRELVNVFIYSIVFSKKRSDGDGSNCLTTCINWEEMRIKVINRIHTLSILEDELKYVSKNCLQFFPPNQLISKIEANNDCVANADSNLTDINLMMDHKKKIILRTEREVLQSDKKNAHPNSASQQKSKKLEEDYAERNMKALRPLNLFVCLALGFQELSLMKMNFNGSQLAMSLDASQLLRDVTIGGPVISLLLNHLYESLRGLLNNNDGENGMCKDAIPYTLIESIEHGYNPYGFHLQEKGLKLNACGNRFSYIQAYIEGGVFVALYENLVALAEICSSRNTNGEVLQSPENIEEHDECLLLILRCITVLMNSKELTLSLRGRILLHALLGQLSDGKHNAVFDDLFFGKSEGGAAEKLCLELFRQLISLFDLIEEMLMGGKIFELDFATSGVTCLEAILGCFIRIEHGLDERATLPQYSSALLGIKLAAVCDKFLRRRWHESTRFKSSNVGKLCNLYLKLSVQPSTTNFENELHNFGRIGALVHITKNVLCELPNTSSCKGPVDTYPTLTAKSFGCYFSALLMYIPIELESLFRSMLVVAGNENKSSPGKVFEILSSLVTLLGSAFNLIKENPILGKKSYLFMQLKGGTRFIDNFVQHALPFLEMHFTEHKNEAVSVIQGVFKLLLHMVGVIKVGKEQTNQQIARESPRAKRVLGIFIQKTNMLMKKNECIDYFCENLKGENIENFFLMVEGQGSEDEERELFHQGLNEVESYDSASVSDGADDE